MADNMPLNGLPPAAHLALGLPATATPEEARAAYLEAVRQHPPDREPERFRELHTAIQAFCDPLPLAESAFQPPKYSMTYCGKPAAANIVAPPYLSE